MLVNVDPASPERGKAVGIVPVYYEQPMDVDYDFDEFTLIAQPATPLHHERVAIVEREQRIHFGRLGLLRLEFVVGFDPRIFPGLVRP